MASFLPVKTKADILFLLNTEALTTFLVMLLTKKMDSFLLTFCDNLWPEGIAESTELRSSFLCSKKINSSNQNQNVQKVEFYSFVQLKVETHFF